MAIRDALILTVLLAAVAPAPACQSRSEPGAVGAHRAWSAPAAPELAPPRGLLTEECSRRRLELARRVGGPGVIWIETPHGPELERFFQDDSFYYLSGVELPDIALALRVGEEGALQDEVLFLPPHDASFEVWNGQRLAPDAEAEAATGFRHAASMVDREKLLADWAPTTIYTRGETTTPLPQGARVDDKSVDNELAGMRLVKSVYEQDCLRNAIQITGVALLAAAAAVRPGAFEYEPQGALEGTFLQLGAERPGFSSIFGSGPNSVTLHYNSNRRQMQDGDLIVMDVGAKYRYYCADVTRTVPVNGRFTPHQRQVYALVLAAQTKAFEAARPGVTLAALDGIARQVIVDGGYGPGRTYFKHFLGHWIGLDVHDVGGAVPIMPGMLFTIEPGIYIADEGLGVRIEDDYLMTEQGAVKVSDMFPSDPDAIEALMRRS